MGFFGSLGRALTAPIRHTNKVVGKAPGMQSVAGAMNKVPGMKTAAKVTPGLPSVNKPAATGIGPSPAVAPSPTPDTSATPPQQDYSNGTWAPRQARPGQATTMDMVFRPNGPPMPGSAMDMANKQQMGGGIGPSQLPAGMIPGGVPQRKQPFGYQ